MNVEALNATDRGSFVAAVGWVFEHSPWVAERAFEGRPFTDADSLHRAMSAEVERAGPEEQLALLRAHPDLGTRAKVSDASASEQAGAGLDRLTREELVLFRALNESYQRKFGFPFLLAVRGSTKHGILEALERRLESEPEIEFAEALRQACRIAAFRLEDCITRES